MFLKDSWKCKEASIIEKMIAYIHKFMVLDRMKLIKKKMHIN